MQHFKRIKIVYLFVFFSLFASSFSQAIRVTSFDNSNFPNQKVNFFLFDGSNLPKENKVFSEFSIDDNGNTLTINKVTSDFSKVNRSIDLYLLFDLNLNNQKGRFQFGQNLLNEIIDRIDYSSTKAGLISYDINSYLNCGLTANQSKLKESSNQLIPYIVSNVNSAFFGKPLGLFNSMDTISTRDKFAIIITDDFDTCSKALIIEKAKKYNLKIAFIVIGRNANQDYKEIANSTNGFFYDNLSDTNEIENLSKIILANTYNYKPSELEFTGILSCAELHSVELKHKPTNLVDTFKFSLPDSLKPRVVSTPEFLRFSSVIPETYRDLTVELTARNAELTISKLDIEYDPNNYFSIVSGNITNPISLLPNQSHSFTLRFSPKDSSIVFTRILIKTDACFGDQILVTGGFPNTPPKTKTLQVTEPNLCNKTLVVGDTFNVEWNGLLPKDVIQIEYSTNKGRKWDTVQTIVQGLKYPWVVPNTITDSALVRIIQIWPNNVGRTKDFVHPINPLFPNLFLKVITAFFNREGSKIITTCEDNKTRVWDATFGNIDFTLEGHTDVLNSAEFSPDDQYIATCSQDRTAIIWNAYTSKQIKVLKEHKGVVRSAKFSPDSKKLITSCSDGRFRIYNNLGDLLFESQQIDTRGLRYAMFSPSGKYILVFCENTSEIRKYDATNYTTLITPSISLAQGPARVYASQFDISPDERFIVATEYITKQASVWDFKTMKRLYNVKQYTYQDGNKTEEFINHSSFHINGKDTTFITSSFNGIAMQWNAVTGDSIRQFQEHTNAVQTAVFDFGSSRVLTASWDGLAKIWNLNERDLQIDTNDCIFKIANSELANKSIDFGDVVVDFQKDTLIKGLFFNTKDFPFKIYSIEIEGKDKSDFKFLNFEKPSIIKEYEIIDAELIFSPKSVGLKEADIVIKYPGGEVRCKLRGIAQSPTVSLVQKYVDFEEVEIGDFKDVSTKLILKNNTANDINIDSLFISVPNTRNFRLTNVQSRIIKPTEGVEISLRFNPLENGLQNSTAFFEYDGNNSPLKIPMVGIGTGSRPDTALIKIYDISGNPGDIINMPIELEIQSENPIDIDFKGFKTSLKFNPTMLEPLSGFVKSQIDENTRIIDLDLNIPTEKLNQLQNNKKVVVGNIQFKVGLGNDTTTTLEFVNTTPIGNTKVVVNLSSAKFRLNNYCKEGEVIRLFDGRGRISLQQNTPNPATDNTIINFDVLEKGITSLKVIDATGKVVLNVFEQSLSAGRHSLNLSVKSLPTGSYWYVLTTPTQELIRRMEVSR
jgi:WD40 repeat protein